MSGDERYLSKETTTAKVLCYLDVSKVLILIRSLGDNESLSLKHLSEKLVVLLALTSADRGSELAAHDLRFRKFHPEGVEFNLPELTKSVRVGKNLKSSFHASFPQDKLLCPCECLQVYESPTSTFRPVDPAQPNKLLSSDYQTTQIR